VGRRIGTVLKLVMVMVVVLLTLAVAGPWPNPVKTAVYDAADRLRGLVLTEPRPVLIQAADADVSLEGHPPAAAVDGKSNTWWGTPVDPASSGTVALWLQLAEPGTVDWVLVTPGREAKAGEEFTASARPREVRVTYLLDGAIGNPPTHVVELRNEPGAQAFDAKGIGDSRVAAIELRVLTTFAGTTDPGTVAVAEVELRRRGPR
jgi:hypothetical protein